METEVFWSPSQAKRAFKIAKKLFVWAKQLTFLQVVTGNLGVRITNNIESSENAFNNSTIGREAHTHEVDGEFRTPSILTV